MTGGPGDRERTGAGGSLPASFRPLREVAGRELRWAPASRFGRALVLRAGSDVVAHLRWHGLLVRRAEASCADGSWVFRQNKWFPPRRFGAEDAATGESIGVLTVGLVGTGELLLPDGDHLHWKWSGVFPRWWQFADDRGAPLVRMRRTGFPPFARHGLVEVAAAAFARPELPLLITLGWFVVINATRRQARRS
ncbi:MAG: hypothetical protein P8099_11150 [Gemmatimonadota bacterium]